MRNLWVAGRALTSACTYLAHMKPVVDGSPRQKDAGRGPGPAQPVAVLPSPAEVTEFRVLGHAPAPAPRLPVLSRSGPRVPAARRGAGPGAAARRHRAGRGPPSATPGRRSAARSAEQCAAAPPLTSHVAVQAARRGPDCPGHCGIATPGCSPREWELTGSGHGSMASARTRRAAARDCGMSPCSLLSPRAGFRRCAAPPPRQPRQEGARTRRAPTRSPGPRPPVRPGPRRCLPPLQLRGLRAQPGRPARLDERLESAAGPAGAEAPHCLEPGGRRAGKKPQGCWWGSSSSNQHSTLSEFCGETDRHSSTNTGHLPV